MNLETDTKNCHEKIRNFARPFLGRVNDLLRVIDRMVQSSTRLFAGSETMFTFTISWNGKKDDVICRSIPKIGFLEFDFRTIIPVMNVPTSPFPESDYSTCNSFVLQFFSHTRITSEHKICKRCMPTARSSCQAENNEMSAQLSQSLPKMFS